MRLLPIVKGTLQKFKSRKVKNPQLQTNKQMAFIQLPRVNSREMVPNQVLMLLSPIWRHKLIMRKDSVTVIDSWVGTKLFLKTNKFLFKPLIWFDNFEKKL